MLESRDVQCHTFVVTEIYANDKRHRGEPYYNIFVAVFKTVVEFWARV